MAVCSFGGLLLLPPWCPPSLHAPLLLAAGTVAASVVTATASGGPASLGAAGGAAAWLRPATVATAVVAVAATMCLLQQGFGRLLSREAPVVTRLFIHPVKSCAPIEVKALHFDKLGVANDRRWAVVDMSKQDLDARVMTARTFTRLALIQPSLPDPEANPRQQQGTSLTLRAPGMQQVEVPRPTAASAPLDISLWGVQCVALDCGDTASAWLNQFLGQGGSLRLAFLSEGAEGNSLTTKAREMCRQEKWNNGKVEESVFMQGTQLGFADSTHVTLVAEASLRDVSRRLSGGSGMSPERFRMNVVLGGLRAYEEEQWKRFQMGDVAFEVARLCNRCIVTLVDPATGETGPLAGEPLRLLRSYRSPEQLWNVDPRHGTAPILGTKAETRATEGTIRIGDAISEVMLRGRRDRRY